MRLLMHSCFVSPSADPIRLIRARRAHYFSPLIPKSWSTLISHFLRHPMMYSHSLLLVTSVALHALALQPPAATTRDTSIKPIAAPDHAHMKVRTILLTTLPRFSGLNMVLRLTLVSS